MKTVSAPLSIVARTASSAEPLPTRTAPARLGTSTAGSVGRGDAVPSPDALLAVGEGEPPASPLGVTSHALPKESAEGEGASLRRLVALAGGAVVANTPMIRVSSQSAPLTQTIGLQQTMLQISPEVIERLGRNPGALEGVLLLGHDDHAATPTGPVDAQPLAPAMQSLRQGEMPASWPPTELQRFTDPMALMNYVMRMAYLEEVESLHHFAEKVRRFNEQKKAIRQEIAKMREIQASFAGVPEEERAATSLNGATSGAAGGSTTGGVGGTAAAASPTLDGRDYVVTTAQRSKAQNDQVEEFLAYAEADYRGESLEEILKKNPEMLDAFLAAVPLMTPEELAVMMVVATGGDMQWDMFNGDEEKEFFSRLADAMTPYQFLVLEEWRRNPPQGELGKLFTTDLGDRATNAAVWSPVALGAGLATCGVGAVVVTAAAFIFASSPLESMGDFKNEFDAGFNHAKARAKAELGTDDLQEMLEELTLRGMTQGNSAPDMRDTEIKALLDGGGTYEFTWQGKSYALSKDGDDYVCKDASGKVVDNKVQIGSKDTVPGYIEIGGLKGLGSDARLYIGGEPTSMRAGPAALDEGKTTFAPRAEQRAWLEEHAANLLGSTSAAPPGTTSGDAGAPTPLTLQPRPGLFQPPGAQHLAGMQLGRMQLGRMQGGAEAADPFALDRDFSDGEIDLPQLLDVPPYIGPSGKKIKTLAELDTAIENLEELMNTLGEDSQLANIDLQNSLQRHQQILQLMSNLLKNTHDSSMNTIRNVKS